mgnify:CR=1
MMLDVLLDLFLAVAIILGMGVFALVGGIWWTLSVEPKVDRLWHWLVYDSPVGPGKLGE